MKPVYKAEIRASGKQAWAFNNTALKSIRDTNENPPGFPAVDGVDLFDHDAYDIKTLHRTKGMDYDLRDPLQPWSWRSMLNSMVEETLEKDIGPGIVGISCKPIRGSYDHCRRNAAEKLGVHFGAGAPVPIWDFVVVRMDGSAIRFHVS